MNQSLLSVPIWRPRLLRQKSGVNLLWRTQNPASENWKRLSKEPNRTWLAKLGNTRTWWMSSWLWTLRLPPTGNCWRERRTGWQMASRLSTSPSRAVRHLWPFAEQSPQIDFFKIVILIISHVTPVCLFLQQQAMVVFLWITWRVATQAVTPVGLAVDTAVDTAVVAASAAVVASVAAVGTAARAKRMWLSKWLKPKMAEWFLNPLK